MSVLIAFGTIEGQTEKIARFVEEVVRRSGHRVVVFDTVDRGSNALFDGIETVILAASVHERRHPKSFEDFVSAHRTDLASRKVMLLSVSLNAAFEEFLDDAQDYADEVMMRTGLTPAETVLVAGAVRPESYDAYARRVLSRVVLRGRTFDPTKDAHEFTDWTALEASVSEFLA